MANIIAVQLLSFLTTLSVFFPSTTTTTTTTTIAKPDGLTIKLTHRDSPDSPFYQPNLTTSQRTQKLIHQSKARAFHRQQRFNSNAVRPKVDYQGDSVYMAQVSIGTLTSRPNSSISYFLGMDSGSDLIWTQCDTCRSPGHHCFPQRQPPFPSLRSSSYRKLVCNRHPLCYPRSCIGDFCSYSKRYADESTSVGFLASETFTFDSDSARKEVVPNIVFGCGFDQTLRGDHGQEGNFAGYLGLGWGPHSLVKQLGSRGGGRFSYCLQTMTIPHGQNTLLRFGSDIPNRPGLKSTDLQQYSGVLALGDGYYVSLLDISIAGSRLRIPPEYFAKRPPRGGTLIDSGCAFSAIVTPAYEILERELVNYFSRLGGFSRIRPQKFFDLCYKRSRRQGYSSLPNLTFHLRGADLVVQPQGAFYMTEGKDYFCLAMIPFDGVTLIGSYQQTNQRFIYDLNAKKLFFGQEDCSRNA